MSITTATETYKLAWRPRLESYTVHLVLRVLLKNNQHASLVLCDPPTDRKCIMLRSND